MNQKMLIMGAAAVLGIFAVGYGVKVVVNKNKEQKVEQAVNNQEIYANQEDGQGTSDNGGLPFNLEEVKTPEDLKKLAVKVGPYTCYITEKDKQTNVTYNNIISTNGDNKVYLESVSSEGEKNRVWVVDDTYYIESSHDGEVQRLKITRELAQLYANYVNTMFNVNAWQTLAATSNASNSNYKVDVKCYKGKVDIPSFNPSDFKDLEVNFNFNK